jgi:hypothetical protein
VHGNSFVSPDWGVIGLKAVPQRLKPQNLIALLRRAWKARPFKAKPYSKPKRIQSQSVFKAKAYSKPKRIQSQSVFKAKAYSKPDFICVFSAGPI